MKSFYQIITTPTADTPGTVVILNFPDKRYLFGQISEGTQRACTELGVRLQYLTDVFMTGCVRWRNTGGLLGMVISHADAVVSANAAFEETARGKEKDGRKRATSTIRTNYEGKGNAQGKRGSLTIHGARNLTHTVATARRFIFRKGMPLFVKEYASYSSSEDHEDDPFEQPSWSDDNIKVWAMPISPSSTTTTRLQSPRKRSHDEFKQEEGRRLDKLSQDQFVRQSVVSDMFNSDWRLDALHETRLADVKMPATIFVRNPQTKDFERYTGPLDQTDRKVYVRKPWPAVAVSRLPSTTESRDALSYVVRNHDARGKFDPVKARDLNVSYGSDYGRLTRGESVVSRDGKTITADMVLGPERPGRGIAFIELPTPEYVEDLVNRPEWKSPTVTKALDAFVWILGPGVGDHPKLREFVASVPQAKHIVSSTDYCPNYLALNSASESSIRLARLKSDSYSVPVHDNVTLPQESPEENPESKPGDDNKFLPFTPAERGLIVNMEPEFSIDESATKPLLNTAIAMEEIPRSVRQRIQAIQHRIAKPAFQESLAKLQNHLPCGDAEIVALGTGSSLPSKYRNVSATLVHVPGYGYYLLDCGENTLGQLKRVYGPAELRKVLQNLRMIWISHLHADHHLGTVSLIKAWCEANYGAASSSSSLSSTTAPWRSPELHMEKILGEKRLYLVSQRMMICWLEEYASVEDFGFGKLIPLCVHPHVDDDGRFHTDLVYRHVRNDGSFDGQEAADESMLTKTKLYLDGPSRISSLLREGTALSNLLAVPVSHCYGAMAVSMVFPNGFKMSYSGDCRPSLNFADIGKDSTLLIHEATFQDDMRGSAEAKKHSTMAEALEIGRRMQAKTILLTHFSQRYQKVAKLERDQQGQPLVQAPHQEEPLEMDTDNMMADGHVGRDLTMTHQTTSPREMAPVAVAFDYMRVRVKDIPIAQVYAPAIEKLFGLLEAAASQKHEERRQDTQEKKGENRKSKKRLSRELDMAAADDKANAKAETRSVWSASESESGWSHSGSEAS